MMNEIYGYHEIEHTADWALNVWAPDIKSLLVVAAKGMYALSGIVTESNGDMVDVISLEYLDDESLVVDFLSELLYIGEIKNLAAVDYSPRLSPTTLSVKLSLEKIIKQQKEITAVTFHNLEIIRTDKGIETTIIFDV